MLKNSLLADKLNAYRNNEYDQNDQQEETYKEQSVSTNLNNDSTTILLVQLMNIIVIFIKSLSYGFAMKTIFSEDWNFIAFLSIGFAIDTFLTTFTGIFNKKEEWTIK